MNMQVMNRERFVKNGQAGSDFMLSAEREPISASGAMPPVGSRGKAPGQGAKPS